MRLVARVQGSLVVAGVSLPLGTLVLSAPLGSLETLDNVSSALSGGTSYEAGIDVIINGSLVPRDRLLSVFYGVSLDQTIQRWEISVSMTPGYLFSNPFRTFGPSVGTVNVSFIRILRVNGIVYRYPLMTNGIARSWQVRYPVEVISGDDASGRLDGKLITYHLPVASGIERKDLIIKILQAGGESSFALFGGSDHKVNKSRDLIDQDVLSAAQTESFALGRVLWWDEIASVRWIRIGADPRIDGEITLADVLSGFESFAGPQNIVTDVTLIGGEQSTQERKEVTADTSVKIDKTGPIETRAVFALPVFPLRQLSDCSLSSTGITPGIPVEQAQYIQIGYTYSINGVTVREVSETYSWVALECARYRQVGSVLACITGVFCATGAVASDSAPAYPSQYSHWDLIERKVSDTYYDRLGYRASSPEVTMPWTDHFSASHGDTGNKLGTVSYTERYYNIRKAIKQSVGGLSWEETDIIDGTYVLGNGGGVATQFQTIMVTDKTVEVIATYTDSPSSIKSVTKYSLRFDHRKGSQFLFIGGDESSQELDSFLIVQRDEQIYESIDERNFRTTSRSFGLLGSLEDLISSRSEISPGAGPVVEKLPSNETVDSTDFSDSNHQDTAGVQPIKTHVIAPDLAVWAGDRVIKTESQGPENQSELEQEAIDRINQSAAIGTSLTMRPGTWLQPGSWWLLRNDSIGLLRAAQVHGIDINETQGESINSPRQTVRVTLKMYPNV